MTTRTAVRHTNVPDWIAHPLFFWPLIVVCVLAAAWVGMRSIWGGDLEEQRARVAALGPARSLDELFPALPPERDATAAVRALLAAAQGTSAESRSLAHEIEEASERLGAADADPTAWPEATRAWLRSDSAAALEALLSDVTRGSGARLLETRGDLMVHDEWSALPTLPIVRCLSARAMELADAGDVPHAARLVLELLAFDALLVEQPTLLRSLVCDVVERDVLRALRHLIGRHAVDAAALASLAAALEQRDPFSERLRGFDLECVHWSAEVFRRVRAGEGRGLLGPLGLIYGSFLGAPLCDKEEALFLGVMCDMRAEFVASPWTPPAAPVSAKLPHWSRLARTFTPPAGTVQRGLCEHRRGLDVARAALALARAWEREQRWPAKLGELVPRFLPDVPRDVPGGRDLVYESDERACRVALEALPPPEGLWSWPMEWTIAR